MLVTHIGFKIKSGWKDGTIGTYIHWWRENKMEQPLWKNVWQLLMKLNIYLTYEPPIR
jgi:hypothetical protein